jgi:hypothetical protein
MGWCIPMAILLGAALATGFLWGLLVKASETSRAEERWHGEDFHG